MISFHIMGEEKAMELEPIRNATPAARVDPDALRAKLAEFEQQAVAHVRAQAPTNTTRNYQGDWRVWLKFCEVIDIPPLTFSPGLLVVFTDYLERGDPQRHVRPSAPTTIERRLSGVVATLRDNGVDVPRGGANLARDAVKRMKERHAKQHEQRGRGQARPLLVEDVVHICHHLPDTLAGHRDRAMLLVGWSIGARRSELAGLHVPDIRIEPEGLLVHVQAGKTGVNPEPNAVLYGRIPSTCPVRAWERWLAEAAITDGPAFRKVDRHGHLGAGLSGAAVGEAIERMATRSGLAFRFTGHALRSGMATSARKAGHDQQAITRQGRWAANSREVARYMRTVDVWNDNATKGIGL